MVQALDGLAAGIDKAMKANKGNWPNADQLAEAMHGLEFRGLTGTVKMREDGQGLEDQLLGVVKKVPEYPFPIITNIMIVPAEIVTTPVGLKSPDWVKTLKPDLLNNTRIKSYK